VTPDRTTLIASTHRALAVSRRWCRGRDRVLRGGDRGGGGRGAAEG
jgi:hypothetical protein